MPGRDTGRAGPHVRRHLEYALPGVVLESSGRLYNPILVVGRISVPGDVSSAVDEDLER